MRYGLTVLVGLLAALLFSNAAFADRRVALVVGNAQYLNTATLRNPTNDAEDVAAMLRQLGFEVLVGTDLDQQNFARQIDTFARVLEGADVGLFFYAGHGLQVNEKNYLVSTSAKLESEFLVPSETIELDAIIRLMELRTPLNLVFLDACRNNPLAENLRRSLVASRRAVSLGRGLAKVEGTGHDTLIAFSAAPGQEAADGNTRNSPFAAALLKHLPQPGLEVSVMLKLVSADVRQATQNAQRPQQLSDMTQAFYFVNAGSAPATIAASPPIPPAPAPAPAPPPLASLAPGPAPLSPPGGAPQGDRNSELADWQSARATNTCDSMHTFLQRYPNGAFADLATMSERRLCAPAPQAVANVPTRAIATEEVPSQPVAPSRAELARNIQLELLRIGCGGSGGMKANGEWDTVSQGALRLFNRYGKSKLDVSNPSQDALAALRARDDRVCPLDCDKGFQAKGDTCVAMPAPAPAPKAKQATKSDRDDQPDPKSKSRSKKAADTDQRPRVRDDSARAAPDGPPPQRAQRPADAGPNQQGGGGGLLGPGLLFGIGGALLGGGR